MKITPFALGSAAVGAALGVASAYVTQTPVEQRFAPPAYDTESVAEGAPAADEVESGFARAEPDATEHDFGVMARGGAASHEFTITNTGDKPLRLRVGPTSCKCTLGEVSDRPLQPGESTPVRVEWVAKTGAGRFEQTATVLTVNDPRRRRIEFRVFGQVVDAAGLEPKEFFLGLFSTADRPEQSVYLAAYGDEPISATATMAEGTRKAELFDVRVEPVDASELPLPGATSGVRLDLTAGPGFPAGVVNEWVVVETNLEEVGTVQVPVVGVVRGDVTIHGAGWSESSGVLNFGSVQSSTGRSAKLLVSFKGEDVADARAEIVSVDPEWLRVELGEPKAIREGKTHQPMTVRIPPNRPAVIRTENGQGDALIQLRTNLASTPEVDVRARFIIAE